MKITNVHKDAYVLHLMGWSYLQVAQQLQSDYGDAYTVPQVKRMIRDVDNLAVLQRKSRADDQVDSG